MALSRTPDLPEFRFQRRKRDFRLMKVRVTIENRKSTPVHHVTEIASNGDLLKAVGVAMETYRKIHQDIPLFDHSTITIERA